MSHPQQQAWCERVKAKLPEHFTGKRVLDCGSLDINGNNRYLFTDCEYTGIDVVAGPNVDIVVQTAKHTVPDGHYDTIVTTEMLEHDLHQYASLKAILRMLASGGLFLMTCATTGRGEHGTRRSKPQDAPGLPWADFYRNLTEADVRWVYSEHYEMEGWGAYEFATNMETCDLYFWGVKV